MEEEILLENTKEIADENKNIEISPKDIIYSETETLIREWDFEQYF